MFTKSIKAISLVLAGVIIGMAVSILMFNWITAKPEITAELHWYEYRLDKNQAIICDVYNDIGKIKTYEIESIWDLAEMYAKTYPDMTVDELCDIYDELYDRALNHVIICSN